MHADENISINSAKILPNWGIRWTTSSVNLLQGSQQIDTTSLKDMQSKHCNKQQTTG
ncbi:unnamed protein product, partial [Ceratitis capitata]